MKNNLLNSTAISFIYRVVGILIIGLVFLLGILTFATWHTDDQFVAGDDLDEQISYCELGDEC